MALIPMDTLKTEKGVVRTQTLFYELSYSELDHVVFTLKEHDTETTCGRPLKSLHRLFVDLSVADASEYTFAQYVFGSWDVWQKLQNSPMLAKHINKWRLEADVVRKSMGFKTIVGEVQSEGKNAFAAAKYLVEGTWKVREAGSPSDKRKARAGERESAQEAFERAAIDEDVKRLKEEGLIN